jgi:6-phospho-beta-glucosidase
VAEALLNHSKIKMIGLCNSFINMHAKIAKNLGTTDFDYDCFGLNHLSWVTSIRAGGKELLAGPEKSAFIKNITGVDYDDELLEVIPAIPSSYLNYFYLREERLQNCLKAEKTRGEVCVELEGSLMEQYKDPALKDKPKELAQRGGALYSTAAVSVVDAIENDKNEYHVVNAKNSGALSFLEDDDVIETKCLVNRKGAAPVPVKKFDHLYIKGLIQAVKAYEKLTVKAVVNNSRADALAALMIHPLIGDFHKARAVLDDMLEANADFVSERLRKNN